MDGYIAPEIYQNRITIGVTRTTDNAENAGEVLFIKAEIR